MDPQGPSRQRQIRIRAVTSALVHGGNSDTAQAYADELEAMVGEIPGSTTVRNDNTVGKRVKYATSAFKDAKKYGNDLAAATNTLPDAMDKLLVDAANRATWGQRQIKSRHASWSPSMAKYTAALKFLRKINTDRYHGYRGSSPSSFRSSRTNY